MPFELADLSVAHMIGMPMGLPIPNRLTLYGAGRLVALPKMSLFPYLTKATSPFQTNHIAFPST
jgi:hypothetical protein